MQGAIKKLWWLGRYTTLQVLIAAANVVSGFLLIRVLDKPNYAWFTIAFAGQCIVLILADSGLSSALTYLGGPVHTEKAKLSRLYELIRQRRRLFSITALVLILPVTTWMLLKNEASFVDTAVILLMMSLASWASVGSALLLAVCRLTKDLNVVFKSESLLAFGRLLVYLPLFAFGSNVIIAMTLTAALQCFQYWTLNRSVHSLLGPPGAVEAQWPSEIARSTYSVLPITIWYCIQGQLITFILSLCASVDKVADIGALGRFAAVFALAYVPVAHYFLPSLARSTDPILLKRRLLSGTVAFGLVMCLLCVGGYLASEPLLLLLGPKYSHLGNELVLYLGVLALSTFGQLIWGINFAKGWTHFAWVYIPVTIVLQIGLVGFIDLESVFGVVLLGLVGALASTGTALWLTLRGLKEKSNRGFALEKDIVVAN